MNIDWLRIKPLNGDVKNGFEELVCQLARAEQIEARKKFIRVAAPDGGVEAYLILSNNDEYGWQAKYFKSLEKSQWKQIEHSFKTAFKKHPNLKKYYVCVPLDRQEPRTKNKKGERIKHSMDVWNDKVIEWNKYASTFGRTIEFEFWGSSELTERLTIPSNEGKLRYWFEIDEFSDNWFKQKLNESILSLGERYTPEVNFDLPIAKVFEGLSRDKYFKKEFLNYLGDLLKNYNKALSYEDIEEVEVKGLVKNIDSVFQNFKQSFEEIDLEEINLIPQEELSVILESCRDLILKLIKKLYKLDLQKKEDKIDKKKFESETNSYSWEIDYFRKLNRSISNFIDFLNSSIVGISNKPLLILKGDAGIGKSHLLADVAKKREARNQFTILLLGHQFSTTEDPWSQILKLLQIECSRDIFLASINSKAESSGARILIFIDAINEGQGKTIWKENIASFIEVISRYPNLGIVFSLRTSYEKLIIPNSIIEKNQDSIITHYGFANHEYEVSKLFFENYKINQPSIPLLHPEFSNPLFLKLFCVGLRNNGKHDIPIGYEGISTIINLFLNTINEKVSTKHNQPVEIQIIHKVVSQIAQRISETNNSYLNYDEAFNFISEIKETKAIIDKSVFFQDLISEGLLNQNLFIDKEGNHFDGVYISYERISDHLVASYLLKNFVDKKNPQKSFSDDTKLYKAKKYFKSKIGIDSKPKRLFEILSDESEASYNKGIIEAISIQLPEQYNLELYEVAKHAREFETIAFSFIDSLVWRKKETISEKQKDYINEVIIGKLGFHDYFMNTILSVTSQPLNYFNSDFLHNHLFKFSMAERDAYWTIYIHNMYPGYHDEATPIRRMIDWAWNDFNRESFSDESIRLMSQTMIWFLTSCNRTLRDSSTKAIICLLQDRINVLIHLINTFEKVNDPYVLQRIYAIAYGCAVRTSNLDSLKPLGDLIFQKVFNTESVYPDILLRDYTKGIIEFAIFKGHKFDFDLEKIYPPFKSDLPDKFPSNEETDILNFNYKDIGFKEYQSGQNHILSSMVTEYGRGISRYGDFGRYTFQSALYNWSVDVNGLSNLAIKWIIERYGYDVEIHGEFDSTIGSGRKNNSARVERIGKKYQWIAFYEILAKVSDNFILRENPYSNEENGINYEGPWEPYVRDIDPTITIKGNPKNKLDNYWWNPIDYTNWDLPNKEWIKIKDDLPILEKLVCLTDENGVEWLVLEMDIEWEEPTPLGEEIYKRPSKRLIYNFNSYIVKRNDFLKVKKYLTKNNPINCRLPDSKSRYQMFSREYYWAAANKTFKTSYHDGNEWEQLYDINTRKYICDTSLTAIKYYWDEEFDASKDESISIYKPSELIFRLLDLKYSREEGQLLNAKEELVCFDPSATTTSTSCLLIKKSDLLDVLAKNDLEIIWTSLGEKQIIGGQFNMKDVDRILSFSNLIYLNSGKPKTIHYEN